ncbi:hypothetical protein B0F90DRAFT_1811901 [Multifurca ochricompacta]|uniref:Uncharacterized protein n=1 Tax=Multifurca ochricompacta TaxID=376703 RepID=A0AAD4LYD0_9AGAM|nr:hypothetical protein B0F90DRAFT_1811901 [Multifurca ochricompacta]
MSRSLGPHPSFDPISTNTSILPSLLDFFHPRKSRQRATILCLLSLVIITTYVCLVSPPVLTPGYPPHPHYSIKHAYAEDAWRKLAAKLPIPPTGHVPPQHRPEISLSPDQELGANVIPTDVDPTRSIDPQLVLDFDTRGPRAEEEVLNVVSDVWSRNPVVVFCKLLSPFSRELKSILEAMDLNPPLPSDASVLIPLLFRLTNSTELPILLIGGSPVGSMDAIQELDASGQLKALAVHAGAALDASKKRKKGRR